MHQPGLEQERRCCPPRPPGAGTCPQPSPPRATATRWGICSAGKISHDFLVALKTLPATEHQAVAIAARDLARAQEYAQKHRIPRAYGSYEELAQDPDVDVVYVGVINPKHLPVGRLFLGAGKPVLLEKPLGMNTAEVRELAQLARSQGVFLMEAFWTRFFPISEQIRQLLAQGAVGEVKLISVTMGHPMENILRLVKKELGGGAILDIGCYGLQFANMVLTGEQPESIIASGFLFPSGVDETTSVILQYAGKRQAVVSCTMSVELPNQASVCGTKGSIELPAPWYAPTTMIVNNQRYECPLPPPTQPLNFSNGTGMRYEAQHVRECLLQGLKESPIMSLADSEQVASIMDKVRQQLGVTYSADKQG
ncbi:trans-1,2-dihydrobenzene-1,2-diol dehydrogenase-like [Dermochelys coriacea]|uniref:trans-1,2-dihydrobenzene-1,2-diol dehydrogenase-like n=1 Tax=Dermochelys coriacea TaxID=27794 RepID=UPI0018E8EA81|nr:trans-1,2-dihydrobenzene-1,2-diol dehydrogenase-like [Dermochelys coriacea]